MAHEECHLVVQIFPVSPSSLFDYFIMRLCKIHIGVRK